MKRRPLFVIIVFLSLSSVVFGADSSRYYFVFLNPPTDLPKVDDSTYTYIQQKHLLDMTRFLHSGFLVAAGPFEGGGGMFIVKAHSVKEVSDSLQTDEIVAAGRSIPEILSMNIYKGKLCEGDGEDMRSYEALRLNNVRFGQKAVTPERIKNEIDGWIANTEKHGAVYFVCTLGGGEIPETVFIVANVVEKKRKATRHYTPKEPGAFIPVMKNFFIARGTFCETE